MSGAPPSQTALSILTVSATSFWYSASRHAGFTAKSGFTLPFCPSAITAISLKYFWKFGAMARRNACSAPDSVSGATITSGVMAPPPYSVRPLADL